MNTSLVAVGIPIKSNIGRRCLINFFMNISLQTLRDYLKLANTYL